MKSSHWRQIDVRTAVLFTLLQLDGYRLIALQRGGEIDRGKDLVVFQTVRKRTTGYLSRHGARTVCQTWRGIRIDDQLRCRCSRRVIHVGRAEVIPARHQPDQAKLAKIVGHDFLNDAKRTLVLINPRLHRANPGPCKGPPVAADNASGNHAARRHHERNIAKLQSGSHGQCLTRAIHPALSKLGVPVTVSTPQQSVRSCRDVGKVEAAIRLCSRTEGSRLAHRYQFNRSLRECLACADTHDCALDACRRYCLLLHRHALCQETDKQDWKKFLHWINDESPE